MEDCYCQKKDLQNAQITSMDFWDNEIDEIWNEWNTDKRRADAGQSQDRQRSLETPQKQLKE